MLRSSSQKLKWQDFYENLFENVHSRKLVCEILRTWESNCGTSRLKEQRRRILHHPLRRIVYESVEVSVQLLGQDKFLGSQPLDMV